MDNTNINNKEDTSNSKDAEKQKDEIVNNITDKTLDNTEMAEDAIIDCKPNNEINVKEAVAEEMQVMEGLGLKDIMTHLDNFDFFKDSLRIDTYKKEFSFWRDKIIALSESLDNFIFSFTDTMLQSKYGIEKPKKLITFPISVKINEQVLSAIQVREKLEFLSNEDAPEILATIKDLNIRKPDEYDFILVNSLADEKKSKTYKKVIDTLLLTIKIMHRQQKRITSLLIEVVKADQYLMDVYMEYADLLKKLKDNYGNDAANNLNEEFLKETAQTLYSKIKNYEDVFGKSGITPKIQKEFQKNLNAGLFNVFNSLTVIQRYYSEQNIEPNVSSLESEHQDFSLLLEELIDKTELYLSDTFNIELLETKRGDEFDMDTHNVYVEPEPDIELEQGKIKQVVAFGFKMDKIILKPTDVILVNNN
jgi:molecular chaperone GrpE (heat shock protein)